MNITLQDWLALIFGVFFLQLWNINKITTHCKNSSSDLRTKKTSSNKIDFYRNDFNSKEQYSITQLIFHRSIRQKTERLGKPNAYLIFNIIET